SEALGQPRNLMTEFPILRYQKQGLRFLLDREQGWDLGGKREDVWKSYKDRFGWSRYKNNINGLTQGEPPKDFRGGISADEMGLGKTLTMLALTAAARDPTAECTCQVGEESFETHKPLGTLIVVPLSLLVVWDDQIEEHMAPEFKRLIYHGATRKSSRARFSQYDVVITTYNVVAAEWKDFKRSRPERSFRPNLITSKWHRVILDEAHMIRSPDTQNAKAVCALDAAHRWCITGTPLQNRTQDIFSLLKFLRVYPYDSFKVFDRDITKPCKVQVEERGLQMLRKLMRMVTLHRGKKVIELPTLQEAIEEVEMTPAEQSMYEEARDGTRRFISDVLYSQGPAQGSSYINAFRRVNKMRYICNHGIQHRDRPLHPNQSSEADDESEGRVNELDHILDNLNEACFLCGTDVTDAQESCAMSGIPTSVEDSQQRICVGCSRQKLQLPNNDVDDPVTPRLETTPADTEPLLPSKVEAIASYVKRIPAGEKCVIFSFWTSTLDIMQRALTNCGISSCRYQGDMNCGGQGLNLTVANHCILVEPQWNPMVEEQAIARVHRLGQSNAVSVARFVMKGTIERKVLERQTRKKVLADLVLGRERIEEGENGKKQLANLMQLIY
ncbi:WD domain-containing protein, partial [Colletotrichum asianum]